MTVDENGGIDLDDNFDFAISPAGDIQTVTGSTEIQKDIGLNLAEEIEQSNIGRAATPEARRSIELIARETILADERIQQINSFDIKIPRTQPDDVFIRTTVTASNEDFELIFNL